MKRGLAEAILQSEFADLLGLCDQMSIQLQLMVPREDGGYDDLKSDELVKEMLYWAKAEMGSESKRDGG